MRERRKGLPSWHIDRAFVTGAALEVLPAVCGRLGTGPALAILPRPRWWHSLELSAEAAAFLGTRKIICEQVVVLPVEIGADALLFIDQATGEWACPTLCRRGDDLVSLAAWRWRLPERKAAWRLAEISGAGRVVL